MNFSLCANVSGFCSDSHIYSIHQHIATYHQIKSRQAHMQMFWNQIKQINITLLATMECQHAYVSWPLDMHNAYMQYILYMLWLCVYAYKNTHIHTHRCTHVHTCTHTVIQLHRLHAISYVEQFTHGVSVLNLHINFYNTSQRSESMCILTLISAQKIMIIKHTPIVAISTSGINKVQILRRVEGKQIIGGKMITLYSFPEIKTAIGPMALKMKAIVTSVACRPLDHVP